MNCILLIDDDFISNYLHKRLVEKLDVIKEIEIMKNGEEALEFVRGLSKGKRNYPDLILLDINMPYMDGLEFLEAYQKINLIGKEKIRIVVLTTSTLEQDYEECRKYGVVEFVTKPLTEEKLSALIGTIA